MEALRRVERYGVFKYDEIISRFALPTAEGKMSTRDSAAAFMATHSGVAMQEILFSDTARSSAYQKAAQNSIRTLAEISKNFKCFRKQIRL
jgi:hypothetical protein